MKCKVTLDIDEKSLFEDGLIGQGFGVKHYLNLIISKMEYINVAKIEKGKDD